MLKNTTQSITVQTQSHIGNEMVMTLNATIPSDIKIGTVNQYVQNPALYDANKAACRKDANDFQNVIYGIEDNYPTLDLPTVPEA